MPARSVPYGTIIQRCREPRTIALTFDDGPSPYTFELLRLLAGANASATFFVGGNTNGKGQLDETKYLIDAIGKYMDGGHQVASHTWSHPDLDSRPPYTRKAEMYKTERVIANILGKYPTYMRPPYLNCSIDCLVDMHALGYHVIGYEVDSLDWQHPKNLTAMKDTVDAAFSKAPINGNMLLIQHDTIPVSALELTEHVLARVQEKGWRAVTVSECLGEPLDLAYRYPDEFWADNKGHPTICSASDGKACLKLPLFKDRIQCFSSLQVSHPAPV